MKIKITQTIFLVCSFFLFCLQNDNLYSQKIVNDTKSNFIKVAIKALKEESKKIDLKNLKQGAEMLQTVNKVLDETTKYMDMLETVSESVKTVSNFKDILEHQGSILTSYESGLRTIARSQFLTRKEKKAYLDLYNQYFKDCKNILRDSKALLRNKDLKMLDGDRIILLNKYLQEIIKIARVASYTNEMFIAYINRASLDVKLKNKIDKYERQYYR